MDMLFKRYACPFPFLDQILQVGRFHEFVDEFVKIHNEETKDQSIWDLYLHHAFLSESYDDFKRKCIVPTVQEQPKGNLEATVKSSKSILDDFVPDDIEE